MRLNSEKYHDVASSAKKSSFTFGSYMFSLTATDVWIAIRSDCWTGIRGIATLVLNDGIVGYLEATGEPAFAE